MARKTWLAVVGMGLFAIAHTPGAGLAADGAALWGKNCASCHGADGKGDTKAGKLTKVKDLKSPDLRAGMTREHVRQVVEEGVVDKTTGKNRMKGYKDKFSAEELDALVSHVLGLAGATQ